jgi:hypothetical protein
MPMYVFQHPDREEYAEAYFGMNDEKKYIDEEGTEWKRVYLSSQLSVDAKVDPWDNADFVNKTGNKKGTVGDMLNLSSELSEQRAKESGGVDPLKQKYYDNYSKQRGGAKHVDQMKKTYEDKNIKIDFS